MAWTFSVCGPHRCSYVCGRAARSTTRRPPVKVGSRDTCWHTAGTSRSRWQNSDVHSQLLALCSSPSLQSLTLWITVFLQCVVGGCNATFASQGGLARHVPTHFSSQSSSKVSHQGKVKEESPSKAGLNKRRKLKNKHRRSLRKFNTQASLHTKPQVTLIFTFFWFFFFFFCPLKKIISCSSPTSWLLWRSDHGRHSPSSHLPQPGNTHREPGKWTQCGLSQHGECSLSQNHKHTHTVPATRMPAQQRISFTPCVFVLR